jgi:hypothetical protein
VSYVVSVVFNVFYVLLVSSFKVSTCFFQCSIDCSLYSLVYVPCIIIFVLFLVIST